MSRNFASTDRMTAGTSTILHVAAPITVALRYKVTSAPGNFLYMLCKERLSNEHGSFAFSTNGSGALTFAIGHGGSAGNVYVSPAVASATAFAAGWHSAIGTYDTADKVRFYVDATEAGTGTTGGNAISYDATKSLWFGVFDGTQLHYGTGASAGDRSLAEVAIWSVVLDAAERAAYANGASPLHLRPDWLVAYWPLVGQQSPEPELINGVGATVTAAGTDVHPRTLGRFSFSAFLPDPTTSGSAVTLTPAEAAFSGVAVSPAPGQVTLAATPAVAVWSAVALTPTPGQVTQALTPATGAWSAVAVSPAPAPGAVTLTPATVACSATVLGVVPGSVTVAASPATAALTAVAVTATPGPVSVTLSPATCAMQATTLTATPGAVTVALTPAVASFTAPALGAGGTSLVTLTPAVAAVTARPLSPTPGSVTVALTPAVATLIGSALTATPGAPTVALVAATVTAIPVAVAAIPGAVTVALIQAVAVWSAVELQFGPRDLPGVLASVDSAQGALSVVDRATGTLSVVDRRAGELS